MGVESIITECRQYGPLYKPIQRVFCTRIAYIPRNLSTRDPLALHLLEQDGWRQWGNDRPPDLAGQDGWSGFWATDSRPIDGLHLC